MNYNLRNEIESMTIIRNYTHYEDECYEKRASREIDKRLDPELYPEYINETYAEIYRNYSSRMVLKRISVQSFWKYDAYDMVMLKNIVFTTFSFCSCDDFDNVRGCYHRNQLNNFADMSDHMSKYIVGNKDISSIILKYLI